jgi:zinc transport system substrate-binding protein
MRKCGTFLQRPAKHKTRCRGAAVTFRAHGTLAIFLWLLLALCSPAAAPQSSAPPIDIFVSILPVKHFVERVGGERVVVSVMVEPGRSPATYEPTPQQLTRLAGTELYFRIGVAFEDVWMDRISAANPEMRIIALHDGIALREVDRIDGDGARTGHKDPHVWTDPRLVEHMAMRIYEALAAQDAAHRGFYEANYGRFAADLQALDRDIRDRLLGLEGSSFMVFHPSWGYFADAYNLRQIPIESGGKEPGARSLQRVIELGQREHVKVIFVQEQFSTRMAETVARALAARVVKVDPLAEDYSSNLRHVANVFAEALANR